MKAATLRCRLGSKGGGEKAVALKVQGQSGWGTPGMTSVSLETVPLDLHLNCVAVEALLAFALRTLATAKDALAAKYVAGPSLAAGRPFVPTEVWP